MSSRFFLNFCLFVVLLTSCSAQAVPASIPTTEVSPAITMTPEKPPFRVVAYATEAVIESLIPYEKLTHINYSFIIPNADGTFKPILNKSKLNQIIKKAHAHDVKVLISVGGWGWDTQFETVSADPTLRSVFVEHLKTFVDEYQLDGADIDWEYPDGGQSGRNFLALMQELRAAMPDKVLSAAVVAYGDDHGLGIPTASFEYMDYVVVMTYSGKDHGMMEQFDKGVAYWNARGLPHEKLVLGLPFYTKPSLVPFSELVKADPAAAQVDSFDYLGVIETYNGIPTIQAKTKFAMENAGGVAFWALEHDAQGELSLVDAVYRVTNP